MSGVSQRRGEGSLVRSAAFLVGAAGRAQFPRAGLPEVAMAGRSNVGKSALLNRLVGRRALARVSRTPGRTRQINFFLVDERWILVDLPGYGFARVPLAVQHEWRALVESYLLGRPVLKGVLVLVDVRRGIEADDALLLDTLRERGVATAVAVTKIDKMKWGQRQRSVEAIRAARPQVAAIPCSTLSGEGIAEVHAQVQAWVDSARTRARSSPQ